jgi:hypothetical protein
MSIALRFVTLALLGVSLTGCITHPVTFQDARYTTNAHRVSTTAVAVIDQQTIDNKVKISSFMTGIANNWEVEPGDMLRQVADIELPQMFSTYEFSTRDRAPPGSGPGVVIGLTIPSYSFANFHASVTVNAITKARDGHLLFEKSYQAEGAMQGGKMFWGGAFGMKSAIRQSSLDAYKQIFAQLRTDLERALSAPQLTER